MNKTLSRLILAVLLIGSAGCSELRQAPPGAIANADRSLQEGIWAYSESDWRRAERLFGRALAGYRSVDDQQGELDSLINLAETALARHGYSDCARYLARLAEIVGLLGWENFRPRIELLYAQLALRQQAYREAESRLAALLPEAGETKPNAIQLAALAERTRIAFARKQERSLWLKRFERSLQTAGAVSPELSARLLRFQAYQAQHRANFDDAEVKLLQALDLYKDQFSRPGIAATLVDLADLHEALGNPQRARNYYERALGVYDYLNDRAKTAEIRKKLEDGNGQ